MDNKQEQPQKTWVTPELQEMKNLETENNTNIASDGPTSSSS